MRRGGAHLTAGIHLYHALVPVVILYTGVFAWPVRRHGERLLLLGLGVPVAVLILGATVPFLLESHIETMLLAQAGQGAPDGAPFVVDWAVLVESGGLWALPLVGALLCRRLSESRMFAS